jgi:glycosyltransferase involved in cell wall biosynthesis
VGEDSQKHSNHFGEIMKIALVCDFLTKFGGAQQVLLAMHELYPDAPIYCLLYDEKGTMSKFAKENIIPSGLQKSALRKRPKFLLPKFASAVEEFDLSSYDVVISSSDSFAHGVITKPATFHLCYCHTPMRYAWDWANEYLAENNISFGIKGMAVRNIIHNLRIWDRVAADRVDHYLANSENVRMRIAKYYKTEAEVLFPPVDLEGIKPSGKPHEGYYLIVSRIEPYKKIKLAVGAFKDLKQKLIVVGEGSDLAYLKSIASHNVEFVGPKYDQELYKYFQNAKAFIFPGEDDFGITPVESMAAGRPVIAFRKGGTLETIVENKTGIFFDEATAESLKDAIMQLEEHYEEFSPEACRKQAELFSKKAFKDSLKKAINEGYQKHLKSFDK